jgi:hypothetical protein
MCILTLLARRAGCGAGLRYPAMVNATDEKPGVIVRAARRTLAVLCGSAVMLCATEILAQRYAPDGSVIPDPVLTPEASQGGPVLSPDADPANPVLSPDAVRSDPVLTPEATQEGPVLSPDADPANPVLSPDAVRPDPVRPPD